MRALRRATSEPALSAYYTARADHPGPRTHALAHPLASALALAAVVRLPTRRAGLGESAVGRDLRRRLHQRDLFGLPLGWTGVAVLDVPADPATYLLGASRQTLRRKVRSARRRGTTWREVGDPAERAALVALSERAERQHADERYRHTDIDNSHLLAHDLWLVAEDAAGCPLLLSVTPVEGRWGFLCYFRTLGSGPAHSDSRYLMTAALVEALAARGVRHLVDTWPPVSLPQGLRHFQRMVGFRLVRVLPGRPGPVRSAGR